MKRAPSHPGGTAVRFTGLENLVEAVLEQCREDFLDAFEEEWTPALKARYQLDAEQAAEDDEAGKILLRLHEIVEDIGTFLRFSDTRDVPMDRAVMRRAGALYRWLHEHPDLVRTALPYRRRTSASDDLPPKPPKVLGKRGASHRYVIVHRVRRGFPLPSDRLPEGPEGYTPRHFALISLLMGNLPVLELQRLRSPPPPGKPAYTVDEVIGLETKYMRKVASSEARDFAASCTEHPGAPTDLYATVRHGLT